MTRLVDVDEGRTSTRAGRGGEETASSWGRRAVVAVAGSPTHAAALTTTFVGGGAEWRWSAGYRASPTASVRDHVPVVHSDAAKCAKMEACVVCCLWTGVREGGNKLRDVTPESSRRRTRSLGWPDITIGAVQY